MVLLFALGASCGRAPATGTDLGTDPLLLSTKIDVPGIEIEEDFTCRQYPNDEGDSFLILAQDGVLSNNGARPIRIGIEFGGNRVGADAITDRFPIWLDVNDSMESIRFLGESSERFSDCRLHIIGPVAPDWGDAHPMRTPRCPEPCELLPSSFRPTVQPS